MFSRIIFVATHFIGLGFASALGADREYVLDIRIEGRAVVEPGDTIRVKEGDKVLLRWISDEATTLHVHGYDVEVQLMPGVAVGTSLEATATGRFPVSSHGFGGENDHSHRTLLYIEVHPR